MLILSKELMLKKEVAKHLGLGVEIAIVIMLPIYLGFQSDILFSSEPLGFVFGSIVASGGFVKTIRRVQREYEQELKVKKHVERD